MLASGDRTFSYSAAKLKRTFEKRQRVSAGYGLGFIFFGFFCSKSTFGGMSRFLVKCG